MVAGADQGSGEADDDLDPVLMMLSSMAGVFIGLRLRVSIVDRFYSTHCGCWWIVDQIFLKLNLVIKNSN